MGSFAPLRASCVHYAYGYFRSALCAPHGPDGELDGRGVVLSPPQLISSQAAVEKAPVASGLLRRRYIRDRGHMQYFGLHPFRRGSHRGVQVQPGRLEWNTMSGERLVRSVTRPTC